MNQDQVKERLLSIEDAPLEFSLVFSGKKSRKVNGLYKTESREIVIHNRNFRHEDAATAENMLMYTAIHEYAHHLHACAGNGKLPARAHGSDFWAIFHALLEKAEAKGAYRDVLGGSPELSALTETIREKFLRENGSLVKEMGGRLLEARKLCSELGVRFEDYVDRILRIPRAAAGLAMRMFEYDLSPATGADNMRFLAGIRAPDDRKAAEAALLGGKSPDTVRVAMKAATRGEPDPIALLEKEKGRIERTIGTLSRRLDEINRELGEG